MIDPNCPSLSPEITKGDIYAIVCHVLPEVAWSYTHQDTCETCNGFSPRTMQPYTISRARQGNIRMSQDLFDLIEARIKSSTNLECIAVSDDERYRFFYHIDTVSKDGIIAVTLEAETKIHGVLMAYKDMFISTHTYSS